MTKVLRSNERKQSLRLDPEDYSRLSRNEFDKVRDLYRRYDANNAGNIRKTDLFELLKGIF